MTQIEICETDGARRLKLAARARTFVAEGPSEAGHKGVRVEMENGVRRLIAEHEGKQLTIDVRSGAGRRRARGEHTRYGLEEPASR